MPPLLKNLLSSLIFSFVAPLRDVFVQISSIQTPSFFSQVCREGLRFWLQDSGQYIAKYLYRPKSLGVSFNCIFDDNIF